MGRFDGWNSFAQGQQIGTGQLLDAVGAQQKQMQIEAQRRYEDRLIAEVDRESQQRAADEQLAEFTFSGNFAAVPVQIYAKASPHMRRLVDDGKSFLRRREEVQKIVDDLRNRGELSMNPAAREAAKEVGIVLQADDFPISEQAQRAAQKTEVNTALLNRAKESGVDVASIAPLVSEVESVKMQAMIADLQKQAQDQQLAADLVARKVSLSAAAVAGGPAAAAKFVQDQDAAAKAQREMEQTGAANRRLLERPEWYWQAEPFVRAAFDRQLEDKAAAAKEAGVAKQKGALERLGSLRKQIEAEASSAKDLAGMAAKNVDTLKAAADATPDENWFSKDPEHEAAKAAANAAPVDAASRAQAAMRAAELAPQRLQAVSVLEQAAQNLAAFTSRGPQGLAELRAAARLATGQELSDEQADAWIESNVFPAD